jgi:hypothetical protein
MRQDLSAINKVRWKEEKRRENFTRPGNVTWRFGVGAGTHFASFNLLLLFQLKGIVTWICLDRMPTGG